MDIAQIVNQRYPMRLFLPGIPQVKGIDITFSQETDAQFCRGLYSFASDLNIDLSDNYYPGGRISIHFSRDGNNPNVILMDCEKGLKKRFRIEGEDLVSTAAWTLFAVATGRSWFENNAEYVVSAKMFALNQQLLASSLLSALKEHRGAPLLPKVRSRIGKKMETDIQQMAETLSLSASSLRFSLVPEDGWGNIGLGWIGNMSYRDLLLRLGCSAEAENDLDAYCEFIRSDPGYKEKIENAVSQMLSHLRFEPMVSIEEGIKFVCSVLEKRFCSQCATAADNLRMLLNDECSPHILTAKRFNAMFEKLDNEMRALAAAKLRIYIYKDYAEALKERYYVLCKEASRIINGMKRTKICYLKGSPVPAQQLNWQDLNNTSEIDSFKVESYGWSDKSGSMLADIVLGGYPIPVGYTPLWLCGEDAFGTLKDLVYSKAQLIDGLNDQLLVAYTMKGLDQ